MPFTDDEMAVAVAIFAIGGMIGALPAGIIADVIGRYIRTHSLQLAKVGLYPIQLHSVKS